MQKTFLVIILFAVACSSSLKAQKVTSANFKITPLEECLGSEDKKAQKLLDQGKNRKNDKEERLENLRKAIDQDPDCAEAHYWLGLELLRTALSKGSSFKTAEFEMSEAVRICPEFHFEPYYFLASMALGRSDYAQAVAYYDKYYKISGNHVDPLDDEKEAEIKLDYEYAKFFADAYANPVPFAPTKVGGVCTDLDEYLPLITPDNEAMLITRKYEDDSQVRTTSFTPETKKYIERFVEAKRDGNQFMVGEPFETPFNQNENWHYGGASISLDNKHLYLTICKPGASGYTNCDIYTADLKYGYNKQSGQTVYYWDDLRSLGETVNTKDGWEAQPSISADGKTLYFATARAESQMMDIYYTTKNDDGSWSEAKPVEGFINTEYNDKTPFMHSDSRTLYFASDGHLGFGGLDVFYARQSEDGTWSKPVNLGHPINNEENQQAFAVSTDGRRVFYSSKEPNSTTGIDIWSFELYKEARPDKVVFVKGTLKNEDGSTPRDAKVELKSMESKNITQVEVSNDDGAFAAVVRVKDEEDVVMNVKSEELAFQSKLIEQKTEAPKGVRTGSDEIEPLPVQEINLEVAEVKTGGVYKINDIYYNTNSAEISAKSKVILAEFAAYLQEHERIKIAIHGHTDNVGKVASNLALSTDRAFSVKQYLESQGVAGSRISYEGFGPNKPIATNDTEQGRAQNRRTEFVIVSQ